MQCDVIRDRIKAGVEFTLAEAEQLVSEAYGHCCIDTHDTFHNFFFHEVCPLVSIARHVDAGHTRVVFCGANARFDGLIRMGDQNTVQKVEFTAAIDGRNEGLIMELIKKCGSAPLYYKIQATGTKHNRKFSPYEDEAIACETRDQELLQLMSDRLSKKMLNAANNPEYNGAWLGIVFDS